MKIAIDARMLKMSGIGTYIKNLIKNNNYSVALGDIEELKEYKNIEEVIEFKEPIYGIKEQLKFPYKELKKLKPDILHVPHYNIPLFYRGKMVVTIHDLTHLILPQFLPSKLAYFYAKFMIWFAVKRANKVLTDSDNTKKDILEKFNVNPDKIEVIPLAAGEEFVQKPKEEVQYLYEKFNIPKNKKILMYVGNLKPHKNLERLLEAFSKIENRQECCLLLVGKAFEKYDVLKDKEKELGIIDKVIHTGIVTQEELVDLYNLVDLFVFPSLYEGFGIPVLEAMACGTKVISSNTSSIKEVGGEAVTYFNPYNVDEIKCSIEKELTKKDTEEEKKKRKEHVKKFNWINTTQKTKEVYNSVIEEKKSKKIKLENINNILMYMLIFFTIFASALNYTKIPSYFSYIKDVIIFYFMFLLIKNRKIEKPKKIGIEFYILFVVIALVSWFGILNANNITMNKITLTIEVARRVFRYMEFFLLFFIFTNIEKICTIEYKKLIKLYVTLSVILLFVHLFGYFVPNGILSIKIDEKIGNGFYKNRITVGQPAIAVYPMIISFFYVLIYEKVNRKTIISLLLLLIGIVISVSTTGILSLGLVLLIIMIPIIKMNKDNLKKILYLASIFILILLIGITLVKLIPSLNKIYEEQTKLISVKVRALFSDDVRDFSMEARDNKYKSVENKLDTVIKRIFGLGMIGYDDGNPKIGNLENTYRIMYIQYGLLGISLFIIMLLRGILNEIRIKNLDNIFLLALFIILAMHSYTLDIFYLPTISYSLSLFYCYFQQKKSIKEEIIDANITN